MMLLDDFLPIYNAGRARVGREKALHKGNIHKDLQRTSVGGILDYCELVLSISRPFS